MTYYVALSPVQEPFSLDPDPTGRRLCMFQVIAEKRAGVNVLAEIASILVDAGVGTLGSNIFADPDAVIPAGPGPFIFLKLDGGPGPRGTLNGGAGAYRRPMVRVLTVAGSWLSAEAKAHAAYSALIAVTSSQVVA